MALGLVGLKQRNPWGLANQKITLLCGKAIGASYRGCVNYLPKPEEVRKWDSRNLGPVPRSFAHPWTCSDNSLLIRSCSRRKSRAKHLQKVILHLQTRYETAGSGSRFRHIAAKSRIGGGVTSHSRFMKRCTHCTGNVRLTCRRPPRRLAHSLTRSLTHSLALPLSRSLAL